MRVKFFTIFVYRQTVYQVAAMGTVMILSSFLGFAQANKKDEFSGPKPLPLASTSFQKSPVVPLHIAKAPLPTIVEVEVVELTAMSEKYSELLDKVESYGRLVLEDESNREPVDRRLELYETIRSATQLAAGTSLEEDTDRLFQDFYMGLELYDNGPIIKALQDIERIRSKIR